MNLSKPLIINAEFFLQCHGHCAGCFLTQEERLESNTHIQNIKEPILNLLRDTSQYSHVIMGFGRGNLLNLSIDSLNELLDLMSECEKLVPKEKITYEVSSSLIGKIDDQIIKATYLLSKNRNIYFNVVINSEITSTNFGKNWDKFYDATSNVRKSWGYTDNFGDILVLNINPKVLPDFDFIENYIANKGSPFNISMFPFIDKEITEDELIKLNDWAKSLWLKFKDKDLNIKNYLNSLKSIDIGTQLSDIVNYHKNNKKAYFFIDKDGNVVPGSLSIMGEVDYVRLLNKFNTEVDIKKAILLMQKVKPCNTCSYQKECILSGAYLNMINNSKKIKNSKQCLSGYQSIFELS
ncbi:hypothetical protein GW796_07100 [archaeon]|nr:hypothetical protein [archaeon]